MVIFGTHPLDLVMWFLEVKTPVEVLARSLNKALGQAWKGMDGTPFLIPLEGFAAIPPVPEFVAQMKAKLAAGKGFRALGYARGISEDRIAKLIDAFKAAMNSDGVKNFGWSFSPDDSPGSSVNHPGKGAGDAHLSHCGVDARAAGRQSGDHHANGGGGIHEGGHRHQARGEGPPLHMHPNEEQFTLITEGNLHMILGDEDRIVERGDLIHILLDTGGAQSQDIPNVPSSRTLFLMKKRSS